MRKLFIMASALVLALCLSLPHATAYAHGNDNNDRGGQYGQNDRDGRGDNDRRDNDREGRGGDNDRGRDNNSYRGREKKTVRIGDRDRDNDRFDRRRHGVSVVRKYEMDSNTPFTAVICGVTFTGTEVTHQEYQLLSNGLLNFKFTSKIQATGTDASGRRVHLMVDNFEIDHILQEDPPDLAPYGGSLPAWVEDNIDVVIEVSSGYNMCIVGAPGGPRLVNHWVFEANMRGIQVNKVTFKASGGC